MSEIDEIYIKAFNQAYLLAKYNADLIDKVLQQSNDGHYFEGLIDGRQTFVQEQSHSRLRELNKIDDKNNRDQELER